jgi:hypothetical protein
MDISKVNDLLGQVRVKLESLDPNAAEEGIEVIGNKSGGSVSKANGKMAHLIAKLAPGGRAPKATGTSKRK